MYLVLSGEGASDMGSFFGGALIPGPMAVIVDKLIEGKLGFSQLRTERCLLLGRSSLAQTSKATRRPTVIPGKKIKKGFVKHALQCWAIGRASQEVEQREQDSCIAIVFRDSDGTNAAEADRWHDLVAAMEAGFKLSGFMRGVVMVPKPKQEAWLLCAKKNGYRHCAALEDGPGNDASPKSLKRQLAAVCGGSEPSVDEIVQWVQSGEIELSRIRMPSFDRFLGSLESALANL